MASSNICTDCVPSSDQQPTYNPTDPSTFVAPKSAGPRSVVIEYCTRCHWLHRATWTSTELFVTFLPPALQSITLVPLDSGDAAGRFRIWLTVNENEPPILVWDRKVEGQFPELKHLVSFPSVYEDFLKRELWALRRNSGFVIISSQTGRLAIQTSEIERKGEIMLGFIY